MIFTEQLYKNMKFHALVCAMFRQKCCTKIKNKKPIFKNYYSYAWKQEKKIFTNV